MIRQRTGLTLGTLGCLWVLIASAVAAGVLAGGLILGILSPAAASAATGSGDPEAREPGGHIRPVPDGTRGEARHFVDDIAASRPAANPDLPSPSGRLTTPVPSSSGPRRTEAPTPPTADAPARGPGVAGGASPPSATGTRPAPAEAPRTAASLRGTATWFRSPAGVSAAGPALRAALGSGWRGTSVRVCTATACVVTVLGDWMRADRLIDLDAPLFARLAPLSVGVLRVTVTALPQPPMTSTR